MGRPDLIGSLGHTAEDMAKLMFNTLQTKILTLPDDVQVGNGNIVQCIILRRLLCNRKCFDMNCKLFPI